MRYAIIEIHIYKINTATVTVPHLHHITAGQHNKIINNNREILRIEMASVVLQAVTGLHE
jgi:hypothetical protein